MDGLRVDRVGLRLLDEVPADDEQGSGHRGIADTRTFRKEQR
ncbi:hypothetical protein [Nocardioides zeae]